jgi:ketosteroid isomerase-like protein
MGPDMVPSPMSQENVEVVRRAYEAFNQGGPEAVISEGLWSTELVWDFTPSGVPGLGVFRGLDEVRTFFEADWFRAFPFDEWELVLDELIDNGDQVIAVSRQRGRGGTSGVETELEQAFIFTLRDGEIVRIEGYLDRDKALEAAGRSE